MRVCQVTYTGFGGLGSVVFSLITGKASAGHEWLIAFTGDQQTDPSYIARCRELGVAHESFRTTARGRLRAWVDMARWFAKVRPEVILCHGITAILPCWWYATLHGARLIAVEHTPNHLKSRNEWIGSRLGMLLADCVVTLTEEYRSELRHAHGALFRERKICVIPNGIDTEVFQPATKPLQGDVIRIGMAARFSPAKRQDLLIAAFEELSRMHPSIPFELSLAGDGTEMSRLREVAAASPVAGRVRFEGLLPEAEVAPWLRTLDIYVHGTDAETLSTSLLQAMASGLPIVASDVRGVQNLLGGPGRYGRLVPNDPPAFAAAISELVTNEDVRLSLARAARERAVERYSHDSMCAAYVALCTEGVAA